MAFICFLCSYGAHAQYTFLPISDTCGTFGIACGIGGITPQSMQQTIYLVNNHKKDQLVQWLQSDIPANKIYGYIGLYLMQRNGEVLTQAEKDTMDLVQNTDTLVNYCQGCRYGTTKISDLLIDKRLKNYYKWYVRSNWKGAYIQ